MRGSVVVVAILAIMLIPVMAHAGAAVGAKVHITGCEDEVLVVPVVNMWSVPGGLAAGARIVGKLSGDGRADLGLQCQGAVVKILEKRTVSGRLFYQVESVVNGSVGWVTDSFIGRSAQ